MNGRTFRESENKEKKSGIEWAIRVEKELLPKTKKRRKEVCRREFLLGGNLGQSTKITKKPGKGKEVGEKGSVERWWGRNGP